MSYKKNNNGPPPQSKDEDDEMKYTTFRRSTLLLIDRITCMSCRGYSCGVKMSDAELGFKY